LSVIDSYDAMTSPRPYHRVRTHAAALSTLDAERGVKHDPSLLDAFLACRFK
ncbi:metal dependent phosphohydrolase, partial [mine drainage metagenome]